MKPILQWAGGKRQLLYEIVRRMPRAYNRYYEPFLGGGAVLFALAPPGAIVGDLNAELINVYTHVSLSPERVLKAYRLLEQQPATEALYYARRDLYNAQSVTDPNTAALAIWLNRYCFNGLWRQNKNGGFNSACGHIDEAKAIDVGNLRRVARYLANITILAHDYEDTCATARADDFVYIDPPYIDTQRGTYGAHWQTADHERLAAFCRELDRRGVLFMLCNHSTPAAWALYRDFRVETVGARRHIQGGAATRREIIVTNYTPPTLLEQEER